MYNGVSIDGYKILKKKGSSGSAPVDGNLIFENGQVMIMKGGIYVPLSTLIKNPDGILEKSLSKNISIDSDSATSIGFKNVASGFASVAIGKNARADHRGEMAFSSGCFLENGDAQWTVKIIKAQIIDKFVQKELLIDGMERIKIPKNKSVLYKVTFLAKQKGSKKRIAVEYSCIAYNEKGVIETEVLKFEDEKLPKDWKIEIYTEGEYLTFYVTCPESWWMALVQSLELTTL